MASAAWVGTAVSDAEPRSAIGRRPSAREYVPAFDGLRTLCVLGVIFMHVGPTQAAWFERLRAHGWFGVDAFFVLSGFLITSILLDETGRTGTIRLPRFYLRRALRLQPAYLSACLLMVATAYLFRPQYLPTMIPAWPYFLTYTGNLAVAYGLVNVPFLVVVAWSLCIEEQFYLIWPWTLRRVGEARALGFLLWAIAIIAAYRSALYCWLAWGHLPYADGPTTARIIFATDTRFDTILIGCALAVAIRADRPRWLWAALERSAAFPIVAIATAAVIVYWMYPMPYRLEYYLVGPTAGGVVFGAVVIALFLQPRAWLARALSWSPLVFVGKISYGVYLFHVVVMTALWGVLGLPDLTYVPLSTELVHIAVVFAGTVAVAWAHYRLVETPFLAMRERPFFTGQEPRLRGHFRLPMRVRMRLPRRRVAAAGVGLAIAAASIWWASKAIATEAPHRVDIDFDRPVAGTGWGGPEGPAMWTNAPVATLQLGRLQVRDYAVVMRVAMGITPEVLRSMTVYVNDAQIVMTASPDPPGTLYRGRVGSRVIARNADSVTMAIRVSKVITPVSIGLNSDPRQLGVRVNWISLRRLGAQSDVP
jgi:peptidoglycan/LPS O-acetylase OafA/YrhL